MKRKGRKEPTALQQRQLFKLCARLRKRGLAPWEGAKGLAHTRSDYAAHIARMKERLTKERERR